LVRGVRKCQFLEAGARASWGQNRYGLGLSALNIGPVSSPGSAPAVFRFRTGGLPAVQFAPPVRQGETFAGLTLSRLRPAGLLPLLRKDPGRPAPAGQNSLNFRCRRFHGRRLWLAASALFTAQQTGLLLSDWSAVRHAGTRDCAR